MNDDSHPRLMPSTNWGGRGSVGGKHGGTQSMSGESRTPMTNNRFASLSGESPHYSSGGGGMGR